MKKILASLAIIGFASNAFAGAKEDWDKAISDSKDLGEKVESSDSKVEYPFKPFVGTIVSPVGNTIYYVAEGLDIVEKEGLEQGLVALAATDKCLSKAEHPGQATGCLIKLGGDSAIVVWNTAGYSVTNVVDYGGELIKDVAFRWRDAFGVMGDSLKEAGVPLLPEGAYIVKFVIGAGGVITKVTAATISQSGRDLIDGVAMATGSFVDVPVQLLNPDIKAAGDSFTIGVGYSLCSVVDLILFPAHLTLNLMNAADSGNRRIEKCLDGMMVTAEQIRAGTYKTPGSEQNYDNKP